MFPRPITTRDEGKVYRPVPSASGEQLALLIDTLDGEVRLCEGVELKRCGTFMLGAMRTARGAAFHPDEQSVVIATRDDVVNFALSDGAVRWTAVLTGDEPAVAYAPDGKTIAVGASPESLYLLDTQTGGIVRRIEMPEEPRVVMWDRRGVVALTAHTMVAFDPAFQSRSVVELCPPEDEARELVAMGGDRLAIAGAATGRVWLEIRRRNEHDVERTLVLDGDHRAEGLAFAGGTLFVATEGGCYRIDPPFEQLVRWLPPLGGTHDPTRLAAMAGGHVVVAARDVRVFRSRS